MDPSDLAVFCLLLLLAPTGGHLLDPLACRRTTNRGYAGMCVRRECCNSPVAVAGLCLHSDYACCYGEDTCADSRRRLASNRDDDRYDNRRCDMVRRFEWDAESGSRRPNRLYGRVEHVIVHHTGNTRDACWTYNECRHKMRLLQSYHQTEKLFPDIPWNFVIADTGDVFEGLGWSMQGYHTEGWNDRSIGVAFLGDFHQLTPSSRAMTAFYALLECGVADRHLDPVYRVYGHRDMRPTSCPGDSLYETLKHMRMFHNADIIHSILRNQKAINATLPPANATL